MARKRKPNKKVLGVALVVHTVAMAFTWRDLSHRRADEVRGHKTFWRMASASNTMWSAVYWLFGRRHPA